MAAHRPPRRLHDHPRPPRHPVAAVHAGPHDHHHPLIGGIVLAGGAGRRMGGLDKAALVVGGLTLLDRVLAAARPVCDDLVVVGPPRPAAAARFVTEEVPGGGPVPAVAAGLAGLTAPCDIVVVLAVDLPLVRADHLRRLVAALDAPEVQAAAADDVGGPNPLLASYRTAALRARIAALGPGDRAARLLPADTLAVDVGRATFNVNRPEDLAAAEELLS